MLLVGHINHVELTLVYYVEMYACEISHTTCYTSYRYFINLLQLLFVIGVPLTTKSGEKTGESSPKAAQQGIGMVVFSRIGMAAPGMITIPIVMDQLEKRGVLAKYPRIAAPTQIFLVGLVLTFATPLCCAIFEQQASIHVDSLEKDVGERLKAKGITDYVYYNKGL